MYQIRVTMYQLSYELFISRKKPVFKSTFIYKKYNLVLVFQYFLQICITYTIWVWTPCPQYTKRARATQKAVMKIINLAKLISFSPLAKEKSQLNGYTQNMACVVMPLAKQPQPQCSERFQIVCRFFFANIPATVAIR